MKKARYDFTILIVTVVLCAFGLVMIFSASFYSAQQAYGDGLFYVRKQLIGFAVGIPLMIFAANFDYKKLEKFKTAAMIGSMILLGLVLIPGVGQYINGARRWFNIFGTSVQPSEIAKFAMILYLSSFIAHKQPLIKNFMQGTVPMLLVIGAVCVLILVQPNFSVVVLLALLGFVMMLVGGGNLLQLGLLGGVGVGAGALLLGMEEYRANRLAIYQNPFADPRGDGYQLIQSLYALGSGGIFGTGLGSSRQKYLFLTYSESDFIFSIIAEELGLIGAVLLLAAYFILIFRGIRVAMHCQDLFGSMMATGITAIIALQVLINVAVVTVSIPPTGVPLPFVSAGSSSLVILLGAVGVLLNISRSSVKM